MDDAPRPVARAVLRLSLADLAIEVFPGFAALWIAQSNGGSAALGAAALAVYVAVMIVPTLRSLRRPPRTSDALVRATAGASALVIVIALAVNHAGVRVAALVCLGLLSGAWYPMLKAELYAAAGDRPGRALAWNSVAASVIGVVTVLIGHLVDLVGLDLALGVTIVGPLGLLVVRARISSPCERSTRR